MRDVPCSFDPCERMGQSFGLCWSHARQREKGISLSPVRAWRPQTERDDQGRKLCRSCATWLSVDQFGVLRRNSDGLNDICKRCGTDKHRLFNYGITPVEYDAMLDKQGGGCAICGETCTSGRRLAVDHDHSCCSGDKTCGKCIRGLLCGSCNQGIGKLRDSPRLLLAAASYLT